MNYNEYKAESMALIKVNNFAAAADLDDAYPEFAVKWENEPIPTNTWVSI